MTVERFQGRGLNDVRYGIWAKTIVSILHHPFGIGLDPHIFGYAVRADANTPHNIYMEFASQAGVLALAAFLWIVGSSMRRLWRARRSGDAHAKTAATALFVGIVGFLLAGLVEPIYQNGLKFQRIFWVLLGMGSAAPIWAGLRRNAASEVRTEHGEEPTAFPSDARPAFSGRR